MSWLAQLHEFI